LSYNPHLRPKALYGDPTGHPNVEDSVSHHSPLLLLKAFLLERTLCMPLIG
jgi:hypothetical protein